MLNIFFEKKILFYAYVCLSVYMSVYYGRLEDGISPLELELQMVMSHCLGTRNQNLDPLEKKQFLLTMLLNILIFI